MEVAAVVIALLVQRQGQASNVSGEQKALCTQAARLGSLGGGMVPPRVGKSSVHIPVQSSRGSRNLLAFDLNLASCRHQWLDACFLSCSSSGRLAKQGWAWSHWEAGTQAAVGPALTDMNGC